MLEGLAVAALAQGDADASRALPGFTAELAGQVSHALRGLASADPAARRAFLRSALARPALDPTWAARLASRAPRAQRPGFRAAPDLLAYLAQLSRAG
jgi:hypothetical protein